MNSKLLVVLFCAVIVSLLVYAGLPRISRGPGPLTEKHNAVHNICISLYEHDEVHGAMPPGDRPEFRDANGRPFLSWRVHILPYVEATQLYEQFHLDEPWDSPHNKQFINKMPPIFALDDNLPAGMSDVLAPYGEDTVLGSSSPLAMSDIADDPALTIMIVEAAPSQAVIWTKPDDFAFDPANPPSLSRFGEPERDDFVVGMADTSIQRIKKSVSPATINSMFNINDGQPTDKSAFR